VPTCHPDARPFQSPLHGATPDSRGENVVWNARLADVLSTDAQGRGVVGDTWFHDVVRDDGRAEPQGR